MFEHPLFLVIEEPFVVARENELIKKLRELMQIPFQGSFCKSDIVRLPHVTSGDGLYTHGKIIVIPWECLEDFVEGEHNMKIFHVNLQGPKIIPNLLL